MLSGVNREQERPSFYQDKGELWELNEKVEATAPARAASRLIAGSTVHYFLGKHQNRASEG